MRRFMGVFTVLLLSACAAPQTTISRPERPAQALILIDLQRGVLSANGPATLGAKRSDALIQATSRAIETALQKGIPIALVKNEWPRWRFMENWWFGGAFRKGSEWTQIDPRLLTNIPQGKQTFFSKSFPSSFSDPDLQKWLEDKKVGELIIGGLYGDNCVTSTALDALQRGYAVRLLPDAIVTRDEADLTPTIEKLLAKGAKIW